DKLVLVQSMAAPFTTISSDISEESVGSVVSRVILFGIIPTKIPIAPVMPTDPPTTPELAAVPPFLCLDDSESKPANELPARHVSLRPYDDVVTQISQEDHLHHYFEVVHSLSGPLTWLPNDIYSLIDSNETAKDLSGALERQMCGSKYGEQDRKAAILDEYETFKANEGEQLLDTYIRYLQVINDLKKCGYKKDNCDVNDALGYKKKAVSANKKQEFFKSDDKKVEKKADEKKRDMSKVKCHNCKKEGNFAKDCKKAKVKDYNYYKTKMLLAKKDSDEQVLLAEDHA
nr:hypothetical protein [Tanacetum cinerariifolium]